MVKVAIVGVSGFTGKKLAEILAYHPEVEIVFASLRTNAPVRFSELFPEHANRIDFLCENFDEQKISQNADVVFFALPHKESFERVPSFVNKGKLIIDLSADYRLKNLQIYEKYYGIAHKDPINLPKFVYGLPEFFYDEIKHTRCIANPGCYPTVSLLAVAPLLKEGIIGETVVIDAKSGVSGAGKKAKTDYDFIGLHNNFWAYKPLRHQHVPEIEQELFEITSMKAKINFCPHVLPLEKGIYATVYATVTAAVTLQKVYEIYQECYNDAPFVRIRKGLPCLHDVIGTNFCDIGFDLSDDGSSIVICGAIDNLMKGASSQAVQNMNIACGFDETMGLT